MRQDMVSYSIGIRLVRNAEKENGTINSRQKYKQRKTEGKILIAFFSESGNTKGIAEEIQSQTGADLFEIEMKHPYSDDYNTLLEQTQRGQNMQSRPKLKTHVENMEQYDIIFLGYAGGIIGLN